jgi:hypothetical protein
MNEVPRVNPEEIYPKLRSGEALLVCAYDSDARFRQVRLEGALSLEEFKSLRPTLPRDREIVFYCA